MKKLAFTALCIGSLGLFACGGGGGSVDGGGIAVCGNGTCEPPDETAASCPDDCSTTGADAGAACNAVAGTGCAGGEKCTFIVESTEPFLGRTDCAPAGTVTEGGTCVGAGTAEGGVDDCAAGLFCTDSVCTEICDAINNTNCDTNETCVSFNGLFEDADNVGLCQPGCNPVDSPTGCPTDEGCYVRTDTGRGSCAADCEQNPACDAGFTGSNGAGTNACAAAWGTQHCNCECLNCCDAGYGCTLNNEPGQGATGSVCAFYCDTTASGGPACDAASGLNQITANSCRQISTFYSNTAAVPAEIGMCVDGTIWYCAGCTNDTDSGCTIAPPEDCDCIQGTEPECGV